MASETDVSGGDSAASLQETLAVLNHLGGKLKLFAVIVAVVAGTIVSSVVVIADMLKKN